MRLRLGEKCGIFGVIGKGFEAARLVHPGLWALQHRGQESSGIASSDGKKIFLHKIPKTGSEGRLHDMWPIFLGGHVDDTDLGIWEAAEREFEEELNYKGNVVKKEFLGIVKMHDTPVNRVHLGLVWLFEGDCEDFEFTGDHGISEGKFVSIRELNSYRDRMTYWSQTCVPYFLKKFVIED